MPPGPSHRSPFDHYKQTAENAPQPDPHRFVLQRLGLTAEEFEDRVTREINETLREARAERNLDLLATPTSDTHEPLSRILTKEDCMTLFRATGVPLSSALGGGIPLGGQSWPAPLQTHGKPGAARTATI